MKGIGPYFYRPRDIDPAANSDQIVLEPADDGRFVVTVVSSEMPLTGD